MDKKLILVLVLNFFMYSYICRIHVHQAFKKAAAWQALLREQKSIGALLRITLRHRNMCKFTGPEKL